MPPVACALASDTLIGVVRILRLAASIAEGFPVSLRDTVPGLDNRNLKLLTTAIRHATGQHPRR